MKAKLKIKETRTGYRCQVCGHTFKTEEAAFIHQFRDCSQEVRDPDRVPGCPSSPDETCAGCMMRGRCWKGDDDE